MIEEPKTSPFAYVLGAVLVAGLVAVGYFMYRDSKPTVTSTGAEGKGSVVISPTGATPASGQVGGAIAPSAGAITQLPAPNPDETAVLSGFAVALARAGQPSIERQVADLLAVLQLNRPEPIPLNPTAAQRAAAQSARNDRIEGILMGSSVFLNPRQLEIYRGELNRGLAPVPGSASK